MRRCASARCAQAARVEFSGDDVLSQVCSMQWPKPPGRSLMSVRGNAAPRGMTAHDRIRLTGPFAECVQVASRARNQPIWLVFYGVTAESLRRDPPSSSVRRLSSRPGPPLPSSNFRLADDSGPEAISEEFMPEFARERERAVNQYTRSNRLTVQLPSLSRVQ